MATILVIDDDRQMREVIKALLSANHECHTADRAEQALHLVEVEDYDLVITDVSMPGLGGLEILRHIKLRHPVPVIVISGHADEYEEQALKIGAYRFLAKPFRLEQLEDVINEALAVRGEPK